MRGKKIEIFDANCTDTDSFPKTELKRIVSDAIPKADRGNGTWGDRAFIYKLTPKSNIYFVPLVCGGTGNCSWRLYSVKPTKYLGEISAMGVYTYKSASGWPTILTYTHMSAVEGFLTTYKFRNGRYRKVGSDYLTDTHGSKFSEFFSGKRVNPIPKFLENTHILCKGYGC